MPNVFDVTIDNTQEILDTVNGILDARGNIVPVESMTVSILSGTGTLRFTDNSGNPLAVNQVYFVSADGVDQEENIIQFALVNGNRTLVETGRVFVTAPPPPALVQGIHQLGAAEPKPV